jgi:6-phosphofructokinase
VNSVSNIGKVQRVPAIVVVYRRSWKLVVSANRCIANPAAASVAVLQFVSQTSGALQNAAEPPTSAKIEAKYEFGGRFFLLPNQFWKHKNHAVVFAAVKALKEQGIECLILCTGNLQDYA